MATTRLFIAALILNVVFFLFGFLWFEFIFKKPYLQSLTAWMSKAEQAKAKKKSAKGKHKSLFMIFLLTYVAVVVVGLAVESGFTGRENGFYIGLLFWAVYASLEMLNNMFLRIPSKIQVINSLYWLIVLVTAGSVLGVVL